MKQFIAHLLSITVALSFTTIRDVQVPPWQHAAHWTLYNVRGAKFYRLALDSLNKYNSRPLNDDSMHVFLSESFALPSNKAPMWMGAYVTTCSVDNRRRKIDISTYGGFFYDETEKKFYSVPQDVQKDWLNYLANCAGQILSNK